MDTTLTAIPDEMVDRLVEDIERQGFGRLRGYVPQASLAAMRSFVSCATDRSCGNYVGLTGAAALAGSTLDVIAASHEFQSLMKRVYERGTGRPAPPAQFYQVLRCLSGKNSRENSLRFHYDSYIVTALIPIEIPTSGKTGDFIMMSNTRKIRRFYVTNLLDKILLDNPVSQTLLRTLTRFQMLRLIRIKPVPGDMYLFWGYRSIHTNDISDPDKVRATALFHFVNPHADDRLQRRLRRRPA